MYKSVLDDVVYLDIETTNKNYANDKIIDIGAIKVVNSEISKLSILIKNVDDIEQRINCTSNNHLVNLYSIEEGRGLLSDFIEDLPIISHNLSNVIRFFNKYLYNARNVFVNSMELSSILEPSRRSYALDELLYYTTTITIKDKKNVLDNSIYTMYIVNAMLCRLWQREEQINKINNLYNEISKIFKEIEQLKWSQYLLRPIMFIFQDYPYVLFNDNRSKSLNRGNVEIDYSKYEQLLREEEIWNNGGNFKYQYREDQEKMSLKIKENYRNSNRIFIEAPTGSGKTFSYLLIAAIITYRNKLNKDYENSNFIISTDTKELQNQLIEKDIPNILEKLNLNNKVSFGAIKGKGNYLCMERLLKIKEFGNSLEESLAYLFLKRYGEDGLSGDLENINFWAYNYYGIEKYANLVNCDSEECNLDRCRFQCYLKNRYNALAKENITVVNHSLLASWPYCEKRKITHLVIDEAHNLLEKSYDFFSEEFNSYEFIELLKKIDTTNLSMIFLLKRLNGLYNYKKHINGEEIKLKARDVEISIAYMINELRRYRLCNGVYNYTDEFSNGEQKLLCIKKAIQELLSEVKRNIYNLYKILDTYIQDIVDEDEKNTGSEYRTLMLYINKLKNAFEVIDTFLEISKDFAKIIEVDKEFKYFIIKNTPLNIGKLINENILNEVKSTVFISATLQINNSFDNIKKLLGQKEADTFLIKPVFDLKDRTKIFTVNDIGTYKNERAYCENSSKLIYELSMKLKGHLLVLFSNNMRREQVYEKLLNLTSNSSIEVFIDKKAIKFLRDKNRQVVILGSKGFFEGIDLPGDYLSCVIIDKIPNVSPTEPVFKALKSYRGVQYNAYNYPRLCIKMKQGYGRLIRSVYDYGYFVILDGGENSNTLRLIEKDLNGPAIRSKSSKEILSLLECNYNKWQRENLIKILSENNNICLSRDVVNGEFKKTNQFWECVEISAKNSQLVFEFLGKRIILRR